MKTIWSIVLLLALALAACSAPSPSPTPSASTTVPAATLAPAATDEPAPPQAPAATQAPAVPQAPAATTEIGERVELIGAPAAIITDTRGYHRLQTLFQGENKCLEGNRLAEDSVLAGATFLDDCQDVPGQLWKLVPTQTQGYYHLQTLFLEAENKCLEGNQLAADAMLGGAAFLDDCQEVSGQLWKFVNAGNGSYQLQTLFLEGENKCFEGNRVAPESVLAGAAFMNDCQEVLGQLWQLVPDNDPTSVEKVASDPLTVEIAGDTLSVVDPSSSLNGMTITQIEGATALSQLNLGKVEMDITPKFPASVTPLSDMFVVQGSFDNAVVLRFPLDDLPEDVALRDVALYTFVKATHIEFPIWSTSSIETAYEEAPEGPIIAITLGGLEGFAFWGYAASEDESPTSFRNHQSDKGLFHAMFAVESDPGLAVESNPVTCTAKYLNNDTTNDKNYLSHVCTAISSDATLKTTVPVTVTITGFGPRKDTRWGGITKEQLVGYLLQAQSWFSEHKLGYDKEFKVDIGDIGFILGYIEPDGPEKGKTLHLTNNDTWSRVDMQGTIVHEYFHHAQGQADTKMEHKELFSGSPDWDLVIWLLEGTARWFEDELYDDLNTYINKEGVGHRIAEVGITDGIFGGKERERPYQRFSFFKLLTRSCPGFLPNFRAVLNGDPAHDPSGIKNLTDLFDDFSCNFGNHLGSDRSSTLEAALAYYNYATQFKNKISLLDSTEIITNTSPSTDVNFKFDKPSSTFTGWRGNTIEQWMAPGSLNATAVLSGVTSIPPVGAYSFTVPAISGTLPAGQVAELSIETTQAVTVSITIENRQISGMNTIGPDNDPHTWFSIGQPLTPGTTVQKTCMYGTSGNRTVPALFVTLVNPSLQKSTHVTVKFKLRDDPGGVAAQGCATPIATVNPTATGTANPTAPTGIANPTGPTGTVWERDLYHPAQMTGLTNVTGIAASYGHSLALKGDGTVWAWGSDNEGQLGGETLYSSSTPVQVIEVTDLNQGPTDSKYGHLSNVSAIAAGEGHSLALKHDGTVWAWGHPYCAERHLLSYWLPANSPVQVKDPNDPTGYLTDVSAIAVGFYHCLALKRDGTVWAWGNNPGGQLGDGTTEYRLTPMKVKDPNDPTGHLTGVSAIAGGPERSMVVKNDGTVWTWGGLVEWVNGAWTHQTTPVRVNDPNDPSGYLTGGSAIAIGQDHTLVLKRDGTVWAWGRNLWGALGVDGRDYRLTPVQVRDVTDPTGYLTSMRAIAAGWDGSLALKRDGTLWTWGSDVRYPTQMSELTNVSAIAIGQWQRLAVAAP